jgi:hypothetical protein
MSAGVRSGNAHPIAAKSLTTSSRLRRSVSLSWLREAPADVDHLNVVAGDRRRDGQRCARRPVARAAVVEIHPEHADDAGEVGVSEDFGGELLPFVVEQCAARRRRADVGHQVGVPSGVQVGILALSS